jgi:hypothetical protein
MCPRIYFWNFYRHCGLRRAKGSAAPSAGYRGCSQAGLVTYHVPVERVLLDAFAAKVGHPYMNVHADE